MGYHNSAGRVIQGGALLDSVVSSAGKLSMAYPWPMLFGTEEDEGVGEEKGVICGGSR